MKGNVQYLVGISTHNKQGETMSLSEMLLNNPNIITGIVFVVMLIGIGGIWFWGKKKKKDKAKETGKETAHSILMEKVPVKIIKKRGTSTIIEEIIGKIEKAAKESEVPTLKVDKKRQLDNFDYTKINENGYVVLTEKQDGQLTYAEYDGNFLKSVGEGQLRDGYYLNQEWINTNFPEKQDKWKVFMPLIVALVVILGMGASLWLTTKYWTDLNKQIAEVEQARTKSLDETVSALEKISRSLELANEYQASITKDFRAAVEDLKTIKTGAT